VSFVVDGDQINLTDQLPINEKNIEFQEGWELADLIEALSLLLLPGRRVSQLDKVTISEVGRQKGIVVEQNAAAVRQFDGIHILSSPNRLLLPLSSINLLADLVGGHEFPLLLRADLVALRDQQGGIDDPAFCVCRIGDLGLGHDTQRIDFVYTPKHGSWLNVAECELSCMTSQCLSDRRIGDLATLQSEIAAWSTCVNEKQRAVDWQFTIGKARVKLKRLYPNV
jgi:hypothetical protein